MSRQWVDNFAEGCQVLRHWLIPIKPRHERPQRKAFARRVMRLFQVDHHHHRWWAPTTGSDQKLAEAVIAKVKARALVLRASRCFSFLLILLLSILFFRFFFSRQNFEQCIYVPHTHATVCSTSRHQQTFDAIHWRRWTCKQPNANL